MATYSSLLDVYFFAKVLSITEYKHSTTYVTTRVTSRTASKLCECSLNIRDECDVTVFELLLFRVPQHVPGSE